MARYLLQMFGPLNCLLIGYQQKRSFLFYRLIDRLNYLLIGYSQKCSLLCMLIGFRARYQLIRYWNYDVRSAAYEIFLLGPQGCFQHCEIINKIWLQNNFLTVGNFEENRTALRPQGRSDEIIGLKETSIEIHTVSFHSLRLTISFDRFCGLNASSLSSEFPNMYSV